LSNKPMGRGAFFCLADFISWSRAAFSSPLHKTEFKLLLLGKKPNKTKNMKSYFCLAVLIT
ncbi:hypothetical protein KYX71_11630, partial [Enterococcus faecium]|nr:hypothetical protein [Enterococcus faecium]